MEEMNLFEDVEEINKTEQQMDNNKTEANVKKEMEEENICVSEEENREEMNKMDQQKENNETEVNIKEEQEEENQISLKRKRETIEKHSKKKTKNSKNKKEKKKENKTSLKKRKQETKEKYSKKKTKNSENDPSKLLLDLFQQPFVVEHLLKYVEKNKLVQDVSMDYSAKTADKNETIATSGCVCRLCTKTDETIFMKLFHSDKTMTPIAKKIAYLMGEHKIEQDLLPQQICIGCSEMVDSSYEALRQFSKSHQILSDVVTTFRNRTQVFFIENGPKKDALYLKIADKNYEFSSDLETTGLERRPNTRQSSSKNVKCFVCLEYFASGDSLKAHASEVHGCKIEYKCASCNITFPTFTDLRAHIKISTVCNLKQKDTELEHETENKENIDLISSETDHADTYNDDSKVEHDNDNTDDYRDSENSNDSSESDIDDDDDDYDVDADVSDRNVLYRRRKKRILKQYSVKMMQRGIVEMPSCKYCDLIFKSTRSDEYIKAHILTHSSDTKESMDINTLDIGKHTSTTSCYVCPACKFPKTTAAAVRYHMHVCSVLRKKYNFKDHKANCNFIRPTRIFYCKTCDDSTPYKNKEFKLHMKENHPELVQEKIANISRIQKVYQKCKTCNDDRSYEMKEFKLHVKENHPELVLNCSLCEQYFVEKAHLLAHIKQKHLTNKEASGNDGKKLKEMTPLLCEYCSLECKNKRGYVTHVNKIHLYPNPNLKIKKKNIDRFQRKQKFQYIPRNGYQWLYCHVCDKKLNFKEGPPALEFHIQRHTFPDNKVECCNRKYDVYIKYKKHVQSHSRNWPCKLCNEPCSSMVQLQDHHTECHTRRCKECGHEAKTFAEYTAHKEKHNNTPESEFLCGICNIQFDKRQKLKLHRNQVHAPKEKNKPSKIACPMCNLQLDCNKSLRAHRLQVHWDEWKPKEIVDLPEPITCCGKKFLRRDNLKKHTAKHIETPCKKCGDVLMSKLALVSHNAAHHMQREFPCHYCLKIYSSSDSLKYHMLSHTHGRQFKCLCGLAYYTESDLRKHQKHRKTPCIGKKMLQDRQQDVETHEVMDWNMEL